jgi:ABC-type multidrug transport system fused ATPase/permease subunit
MPDFSAVGPANVKPGSAAPTQQTVLGAILHALWYYSPPSENLFVYLPLSTLVIFLVIFSRRLVTGGRPFAWTAQIGNAFLANLVLGLLLSYASSGSIMAKVIWIFSGEGVVIYIALSGALLIGLMAFPRIAAGKSLTFLFIVQICLILAINVFSVIAFSKHYATPVQQYLREEITRHAKLLKEFQKCNPPIHTKEFHDLCKSYENELQATPWTRAHERVIKSWWTFNELVSYMLSSYWTVALLILVGSFVLFFVFGKLKKLSEQKDLQEARYARAAMREFFAAQMQTPLALQGPKVQEMGTLPVKQ